MRALAFLLLVMCSLLASTSSGSALPGAYGISKTRTCLAGRGASFNSITPGVAHSGLTAGQQAEVLSGTLPAGGAPVFFVLVIGQNSADAAAVLKVLRPQLPIGTHWTSEKENAAWTLTSLAGPVTEQTRTLLTSCLRTGPAPTGVAPSPARYSAATVGSCLAVESNGAVVRPVDLKRYVPLVFGGRAIPPSILPHTLLAYTATSSSARDGIGIFVVFGPNGRAATSMLRRLEQALSLTRSTTTGVKKNAAWAAFSVRLTTPAGRKAGLKALHSCLN